MPYFYVYGTLQLGYKNHNNFVRNRYRAAQDAYMNGAECYHFHGFPGLYEVDDANKRVFGQVLDVPDDVYEEVLADLDALEEFYGPNDPRNVYERVKRTVTVLKPSSEGAGAMPAAETVEAWVYVSRMDITKEGAVPVPGGHWSRWLWEQGLQDTGDDWSHTLARYDTLMGESAKLALEAEAQPAVSMLS